MEKILAIDIGGTSIKIGVIENTDILEVERVRNIYKNRQDDLIPDIKEILDKFIEKYGISKIGISSAGQVNGNIINYAANLSWQDFDIVGAIKKYYPNVEIRLENDGNAACLAELTYGKLKGVSNGLFVVLGKGIGGAIIVDGKMLKGANNLAGNFGHIVIKENGRRCRCGKKGCFETYGSASGLVTTFLEINKNWENQSIKISLDMISGSKIDEFYSNHNPIALEAVRRWNKDLSIGLRSLCEAFDPEIIVIAGGITDGNLVNMKYLSTKISAEPYFQSKVSLSQFKGNAGMIGASLLFKQA